MTTEIDDEQFDPVSDDQRQLEITFASLSLSLAHPSQRRRRSEAASIHQR